MTLGVALALPLALPLALCVAISLAACGPDDPPEGTSRPLEKTWQNGVVRIRATEIFHDGEWVKHGPAVFFDEDGDESHRGEYDHGLESGVWTERNDDGGTGRGPYRAGKRHGAWTYMHANGRLAEEGQYVDGRRDGIWKAWAPSGAALPDKLYPQPDEAR